VTIDQARRLQLLARWHRRIALGVFAWVAVLALSGVLINHANDWGLDRRPLADSLQYLLYGIERDVKISCVSGTLPAADCGEIFARLALPEGELWLSGDALFLLGADGALIERIGVSQLGLGKLQAGLIDGTGIYLQDAARIVETDADLLDWRELEPAAAARLKQRDWQFNGSAAGEISWERLLLDLHAGRFLGPLASGFTDLMGLLILSLTVTGFWIWRLKRRPT